MKFNTLENAVALFTLASLVSYAQAADKSVMSVPHDSNIYTRPAIPEDLRPLAKALAPIITSTLVVDAVVNNTDPALKNSDTVGFRGEVSIGIVKSRHEHHEHDGRRGPTIVLTDFEEPWGTTAPLWRSPDGGLMWTKEFTINPPPGDSGAIGCPCDQSVDFNPVNGTLAGTFLTTKIFSGLAKTLRFHLALSIISKAHPRLPCQQLTLCPELARISRGCWLAGNLAGFQKTSTSLTTISVALQTCGWR